MDDWSAEASAADERAAPRRVVRARGPTAPPSPSSPSSSRRAQSPALVVGAGADDPDDLESARRAGRAARMPRLAGVLQRARRASRRIIRSSPATCRPTATRLRETLAPHDLVLAVGAPVFRQYPFIAGPVRRGRDDRRDDQRGPGRGASQQRPTSPLLAPPAPVCAELARVVPARTDQAPAAFAPPAAAGAPAQRASRCAPDTSSPRSPSASRATRS